MAIRVYQLQGQVLVDPADAAIIRTANNNLGLTQSGEEGSFYRYPDHVDIIEQSVDEFVEIGDRIPVTQNLNLTQEALVDGFQGPSQDLSLTQSASFLGPRPRGINQTLNIGQSVQFTKSNLPWSGFHVGTWLLLKSAAGFPLEVSADSDLNLDDFGTPWNGFGDLTLTQETSAGKGIDAGNSLGLSGDVELDADYNPDGLQELGVKDAVAYYIESRCGRSKANNFHGSGGVAPTPEPLKYQSKLAVYSETDLNDLVSLRNPETDNRYRVSYQRVNRSLFDGSPDVYADPNWVDEFEQLYTIVALKRDTLDNLFEFFLRHLGDTVIVRDWEGVSWYSIINNVSEVHTEDAEGYWTIELQLQSTRAGGEVIPHNLNLSSTAFVGVDRPASASSSLDISGDTGYTKDWGVTESDALGLTTEATYSVLSP